MRTAFEVARKSEPYDGPGGDSLEGTGLDIFNPARSQQEGPAMILATMVFQLATVAAHLQPVTRPWAISPGRSR